MRALWGLVVLSLSVVVHAEPMPLAEARALIGKKALDEVYVAFSSIKKGAHPAGDVAVAQLLVEAARAAIEGKDPSLALGLTDKARKLDPKSVDACLANADALLALDQRGAAEDALEAALQLAPKDVAVIFRRADYAEQEGQLDRALELFRRIPASHAQGAIAKARVERIKTALAEEETNLADLAKGERDRVAGAPSSLPADPQNAPPPTPTTTGAPPASDGTIPDGMAARESSHFRIVYSGGQRDFAQRAQYEQKVLDMFERAYSGARTVLGRTSPRKVDVVLYTAEEFRFHFGSMFGGGVLGFYSGKIRMNRAESLDDRFYGTAVHEYVHALVDDVMSGHSDGAPVWLHEGLARWVERKVAGGDHIDFHEKSELKRRAQAGSLPTFASLAGRAATELGGDAWVPYAKGACAVETLSTGGGVGRLVRVLEATGKGRTFDDAFGSEFGATRLGQLDAEVAASVAR